MAFSSEKVRPGDPNFASGVIQQAELHGFFAIAIPESMQEILVELETKNLNEQQKIQLLNALADAPSQDKVEISQIIKEIIEEKNHGN